MRKAYSTKFECYSFTWAIILDTRREFQMHEMLATFFLRDRIYHGTRIELFFFDHDAKRNVQR